MIFNDFDEFLKAFQALYATEQCFFFVKSLLKVCLFGVPVILLMLTAETLMLDNSSKCFSDSFGKYSRHIHLHRVYVLISGPDSFYSFTLQPPSPHLTSLTLYQNYCFIRVRIRSCYEFQNLFLDKKMK